MHASTGYTPFHVIGLTHPRVPLTLSLRGSGIGVGGVADRLADISPATIQKLISEFLATRLNVLRHVRDSLADIQDKQKKSYDAKGRGCIKRYKVEDLLLLNAKKTTYKCSVRRLRDKVASALHSIINGHC